MLEADLSSNRLDVRTNVWVLAWLLTLFALTWPLWNGLPIVFPTRMAILRGRSKRPWGHSAIYGAFLVLAAKRDFWPNIIMQGVLVTWLVLLKLRPEGLGGRPWLAIAILTGLCVTHYSNWLVATSCNMFERSEARGGAFEN